MSTASPTVRLALRYCISQTSPLLSIELALCTLPLYLSTALPLYRSTSVDAPPLYRHRIYRPTCYPHTLECDSTKMCQKGSQNCDSHTHARRDTLRYPSRPPQQARCMMSMLAYALCFSPFVTVCRHLSGLPAWSISWSVSGLT